MDDKHLKSRSEVMQSTARSNLYRMLMDWYKEECARIDNTVYGNSTDKYHRHTAFYGRMDDREFARKLLDAAGAVLGLKMRNTLVK